MKRYYDILGLSPSASPRKIREQYRKLAKTYHPDKLADPAQKAEYEDKLKEINEAYEALSEIVKRANLTPQERKLDFLYRRGQELLEQRKYSQAMVVLTEILAINSAYRDARSLLQETRRKHKHVAALYAKADDFYRQKKWAEAALAFEEVLKADSNYRDAAKKLKKVRREQLMSDFMKQY